MVPNVAGPEDAHRETPRHSGPHQPFSDPFGLVVTTLQSVYEAVYFAVLQIGCVVPSWKDAIGGDELNWFHLGVASEFDHLPGTIHSMGFNRGIGIDVIDGGRAMKNHIYVF